MNTLPTQDKSERAERVILGLLGAFLFSLAGGLCWFTLYRLNLISAVSGIVGVVCAIKGYSLFAKKESVGGVIAASVIAFAVLAGAWFLCFSYDVYEAHQDWYAAGDIGYTLSFSESIEATAKYYIHEPEVAKVYFRDLIVGMVFALLGASCSIATAIRKIKMQKLAANIKPDEESAEGEDGAEPDDFALYKRKLRRLFGNENHSDEIDADIFSHMTPACGYTGINYFVLMKKVDFASGHMLADYTKSCTEYAARTGLAVSCAPTAGTQTGAVCFNMMVCDACDMSAIEFARSKPNRLKHGIFEIPVLIDIVSKRLYIFDKGRFLGFSMYREMKNFVAINLLP